jgi:hypothetical protein
MCQTELTSNRERDREREREREKDATPLELIDYKKSASREKHKAPVHSLSQEREREP